MTLKRGEGLGVRGERLPGALKVAVSHSVAMASEVRLGFQARRPKAYQLAWEK